MVFYCPNVISTELLGALEIGDCRRPGTHGKNYRRSGTQGNQQKRKK